MQQVVSVSAIQTSGFAQTTTNSSSSSDASGGGGGGPNTVKNLRIGYFPNINHAQAVIGLGNADFQKALGNNIKVQTFIFNAGPSAIEACLQKGLT